MRFPVKINRGYWPSQLCKVLPAANDVLQLVFKKHDQAAFSDGVCALKIDGVFKTTKSARYPTMIEALRTLSFSEPPVILDVAASDGSAAVATLENLDYSHYYITDRNIVIYWTASQGMFFFYEPSGNCFMAASKKMVYYADTAGALWPLGQLASHKISKAPKFIKDECDELVLLNPAVNTADTRITVQQHDLFTPWSGKKPSLIIAANILNFNYFDAPTLRRAIKGLVDTLDGDGYLAIVDNRPGEHGSLFSLAGTQLALEKSINGGALTESLTLELAVSATD